MFSPATTDAGSRRAGRASGVAAHDRPMASSRPSKSMGDLSAGETEALDEARAWPRLRRRRPQAVNIAAVYAALELAGLTREPRRRRSPWPLERTATAPSKSVSTVSPPISACPARRRAAPAKSSSRRSSLSGKRPDAGRRPPFGVTKGMVTSATGPKQRRCTSATEDCTSAKPTLLIAMTHMKRVKRKALGASAHALAKWRVRRHPKP